MELLCQEACVSSTTGPYMVKAHLGAVRIDSKHDTVDGASSSEDRRKLTESQGATFIKTLITEEASTRPIIGRHPLVMDLDY